MSDGAGRSPAEVRDLFTAFLKIGALGFGGVAPIARHVLVVERGILDERAYAEMFGFASTLPGANTVNLAAILGDRLGGPRGSAAALLGLLGAPLCVLVLFAGLYQRFGGVTDVRVALAGAAAAAAGLVAGTALRLLLSLGREAGAVTLAAAVCVAAWAGAPLLATLAAAIPASVAWQLLRSRYAIRRASGQGQAK